MDITDNGTLPLHFSKCLRRLIQEVLSDGKIGISGINTRLVPFPNRRVREESDDDDEEEDDAYSYQCLLEIPYAGKLLEWEVLFSEEDCTFAPDFDFRDEYFLADPTVAVLTNNVPSLANWRAENSKALINVIREFHGLYKKTQIDRLQTDIAFVTLSEEYKLLIESGVEEENVEVNIDSNQGVVFLISIVVDFSSLPPYIQPAYFENGCESQKLLNCSADSALLKIHFSKPESGRATAQLHLSPRLEQVLGDYRELHIPPYDRDCRLADYVHDTIQLLKNTVEDIETHHRLRNEYISSLLSMFPGNIVEYDSSTFSKATLLCEVDGHYCLVDITIGDRFPREKPTVVLRSVYNMGQDEPCSVTVNDFPYSPTWKPEEMVAKLFTELAEVLPKFKQQFGI